MIRGNWLGVKRQAGEMLKEAIWACCTVQPKKPPILLFSSRRSGSTMLMEVIAANRGILPIGQPFATYSASATQLQHMLSFLQPHGQLIYPDKATQRHILNYFDDLLNGKLIINAPWRFWHRSFRRKSQRVALKILAAKGMIEVLAAHSQGQVVYSTRHPIPQSLSLMRNNWGLTVQAYLNNLQFVKKELNQQQHDFCMDTLRGSHVLSHYVLNWVLENLIPLRALPSHPEWLYLDYESCVLQPDSALRKLQKHLKLDDTVSMSQSLLTPSRSSRKLSTHATQKNINANKKSALVNHWRDHVSVDDERQAMRILEQFDIDLYRFAENTPKCNN